MEKRLTCKYISRVSVELIIQKWLCKSKCRCKFPNDSVVTLKSSVRRKEPVVRAEEVEAATRVESLPSANLLAREFKPVEVG